MSELLVIAPGGGEIVGDSPDRRVEILSDHGSLAATWSRFGPRREGADLHVHRHHSDVFYVIDGELTLRLGLEDEPLIVPAGMLALVPPLVVHGFRNAGDADVRYLNFHAPGMQFAEYMRALRDKGSFSYDQHDPPEEGVRPSAEAEVAVTRIDDPYIAVGEQRLRAGESFRVRAAALESLYVLDGSLDGRPTGAWLQLLPGGTATLGAGAEGARLLRVRTPGSPP
jgi:mannose-6-phosphate isomerase-like protein (cupin superfamily)